MSRALQLDGKRVGRWTVVARAANNGRRAMWDCRCDCGNTRTILADHLARGCSTSCGCARPKPPRRQKRKPVVVVPDKNRSFTGAVKTHAMRSREEAIADTFRDPLRLLDAWRKRIAA